MDFGKDEHGTLISYSWSRNSLEIGNQEKREQSVFSTIFFSEKDIPNSPSEPDETDSGIPIKLTMIPCDDLAGLSEQVIQNMIPTSVLQPPLPPFSNSHVWNSSMNMNSMQLPISFTSNQPLYPSHFNTLPFQSSTTQSFTFSSSNMETCRFWLKGNCKFGEKCHYSHPPR